MSNKIKELCEKAMKVIDSPEKWCQGDLAVNKDGKPVRPYQDDASRFSLYGALMKVALENKSEFYPSIYLPLINDRFYSYAGTWIPDFNYSHSYEEVVATWRKFINSFYISGFQ